MHQFTNLKCCKKAREPFKTLFNRVLFLVYYIKKHFLPCFFILKALKDILLHFKLVNSCSPYEFLTIFQMDQKPNVKDVKILETVEDIQERREQVIIIKL